MSTGWIDMCPLRIELASHAPEPPVHHLFVEGRARGLEICRVVAEY